ncbi:hypothetical protein [Microbacterium phyllosphaerae]|uniref:hypothetical protein n=1 Tax=Microbacterium phyllosphaerae TaxID=124798 RepID=UPI002167B94B|nr:hypothetical protein [Microbacterium phyllosphaerae]MCS3442183.1 hypothetical protein [Microbacterium phyllosphaerae]
MKTSFLARIKRRPRTRRGILAGTAVIAAVATTAALIPVDAITTIRSTIFDSLFGTEPIPPSTPLGVYDLELTPTSPANFFADGIDGTISFSTLDSGTAELAVNAGETLEYTITLPDGLTATSLPAEPQPAGWTVEWDSDVTDDGENVIRRTKTATAAHVETADPESFTLDVRGDSAVADGTQVLVEYEHPRLVSESASATARVNAVVATDWGVWGAAAVPDTGNRFRPETTGTVSFSTLNPVTPDASETLTYAQGDERTYVIELPAGLEYEGSDAEDSTGWTISETATPAAGGGTTITIVQTAQRDFDEEEFTADTYTLDVIARELLADNSPYSITYIPSERHKSTNPQQAGVLLATTPIPIGVHNFRSTNPTWGANNAATDKTDLQFDTLPSDSAAIELDLKPGDKISYTLLPENPRNSWSALRDRTVPIATDFFEGFVRPRYQKPGDSTTAVVGFHIELVATQELARGIYHSEVVSWYVETSPNYAGVSVTVTTELPEKYRPVTPVDHVPLPSFYDHRHSLPSGGVLYVTTPGFEDYRNDAFVLYDNFQQKFAWYKGSTVVTTVTAPEGVTLELDQSYDPPNRDWTRSVVVSDQGNTAVVTYTAQTDYVNYGAGVKFKVRGQEGGPSMEGKSISIEAEYPSVVPPMTETLLLSGYLEAEIGVYDADVVVDSTQTNVFPGVGTGYGTVNFSLLPGSDPQPLPVGKPADAVTIVVRIPNANGRLQYNDTTPSLPNGWLGKSTFRTADGFLEIFVTITNKAGKITEVPSMTVKLPRVLKYGGRAVPGTYAPVANSGIDMPWRVGLLPSDYVDRDNPGGRTGLSPEYVLEPAP